MAKKDAKPLTKRQIESQKIMRQKAAQIRRQHFMQKFRIFGGIAFVLVAGIGGFWGTKTGAIAKLANFFSGKIYGATSEAGYELENIYLEGRGRTPLADINSALDIDKGTPILSINLQEMRARLEKIESIKSVTIERALPSTIFVRIVEREPVALWQYQGKISLVDDNGVVMKDLDIAPYKDLPLIVGDGAPGHVAELAPLLSLEPELSKRFSAAVWVGGRRWNIKLRAAASLGENAEDIEIRLPEKNYLAAWKQLAKMQKDGQVLDREVKVIDLRIEGKTFIKVPEIKNNKGSVNSKLQAAGTPI